MLMSVFVCTTCSSSVSPRTMATEAFFFDADGDVAFEEELARNPYSIKAWLSYIASKHTSRPRVRCVVAERMAQ